MDLKLSVTHLDTSTQEPGYRMVPLYDDADVEITMLIQSEHGQEYIVIPAPESKCYQSGSKIPSWQAQRKKVVWATVQPLVFVNPKRPVRPGEMYDFCVRGYLAHGGNIADENTTPVSPIQLRRERPELEAFFQHPALQPLFESCPCIGLHHIPEQFSFRRILASTLFKQKIIDWCDDVSMHLYTIDCFYRISSLVNMSGDYHRQQQLPHFLSRDIKDGIEFVMQAIENMSDEDFDIQGRRRAHISCAVLALIKSSRAMKMVKRLDPRVENTIESTLTLMTVDTICTMLDHCIRLSK
jgi:hypothetical protein